MWLGYHGDNRRYHVVARAAALGLVVIAISAAVTVFFCSWTATPNRHHHDYH